MANRTFISIIIFSILLTVQSLYAADKLKIISEPSQKIDVPYRIYRTDNMWKQLLLDTQTGKLWQISLSYGIDDLKVRKVPINVIPLAKGNNATIGRFTLYPMDNMNFLLLDQIDGRVWHYQLSIGDDVQTILPLEDIIIK